MRHRHPLALTVAAAAVLSNPTIAGAAPAGGQHGHDDTFAVIGDLPYGQEQIDSLPQWIQQINNADPDFTIHVGDIKNGSTRCDDAYYSMIRQRFDSFTGPLVYTPGDNEWTDCHRANNGSYQPLERLAKDRAVFFSDPTRSLGQHPMKVDSQVNAGFPENVNFRRHGIDFAVVHVVGSNDDLQPWTGVGQTQATTEQLAEQRARMTNAISVIHNAFRDARRRHDPAVMILQQADMFDPSYTPKPTDISAFTPLVQALINESSDHDGQVYLVNGDSHRFNVDRPLAGDSSWLRTYGVKGSANNLQRITVDGSDNNKDWLQFTVHHGREHSLTWEQIPYTK